MTPNPFTIDRLNTVYDFHPEWDVPSLHADVSAWLEKSVASVESGDKPCPDRKICVLNAGPGLGKTHLFGRLVSAMDGQVLPVFVPQIENLQRPMDHFRWHLVESLFRDTDRSGTTLIADALARITWESFRDYFQWLPETIKASHAQLGERLQHDPLAVLQVIQHVMEEPVFLRLADSMATSLNVFAGIDSSIVRALALGWAPTHLSLPARKWLRGDTLPEEQRQRLGFPEHSPETSRVFSAVAALLKHERPIMLACDQLEAILRSPEHTASYTNALTVLLQQVPNLQIVISCLDDRFDDVIKHSDKSFRPRCESRKLEPITGDQAVELLQNRLVTWRGRHSNDPTWPFQMSEWKALVDDERPPVRNLLNLACQKFQEWLDEDCPETRIRPDGGGDPEEEFPARWQHELEFIRSNVNLSPEHLQESQLYSIFFEAFSTHRDFKLNGLPPITAIKGDVLPGTANSARYGMQLSAGKQNVVVTLTKLDTAQKFQFFLTATQKCREELSALRYVIVHHQAQPATGSGKTKEKLDNDLREGLAQTISLQQDHPEDFHVLHCFSRLLRQAEQGKFVIGGNTLTPDDCRKLAVELGYLDGMKLLASCLAEFSGPGVPSKTPTDSPNDRKGFERQSDGNSANGRGGAVRAPVASGTGPQPAKVEARNPANPAVKTAAPPAVNTFNDAHEWAHYQSECVVTHLRALNVAVEAAGTLVGPVFARLLVRPLGGTTINRVKNRAEDLKLRLGLAQTPVVDSNAGAICIDVELPHQLKTVVTLADALLEPPNKPAHLPLFPVGQDVAGKTHWADLSDTNTCHFLIAGTTGSGKSELLISIVAALARRLPPSELQFILIDPKRVTFNLQGSNSPYLKHGMAYSLEEALPKLQWAFQETERRYKLLQQHRVKNLKELRGVAEDLPPRIVVACDEFADLMADAKTKEALELPLRRMSAKSRAAGIHLILATQRPEKTVVTPLIRTNLPGRLSLQVKSKGDSEIILNRPDACQLLGKGDLLWEVGAGVVRLQSPLTTQEELEDALRF